MEITKYKEKETEKSTRISTAAIGSNLAFEKIGKNLNISKLGHGHSKLMAEDVGLVGQRFDDGSSPWIGVQSRVGRQKPHFLREIRVVGAVEFLRRCGVKIHVIRRPSALSSQEIQVFWAQRWVRLPRRAVIVKPALYRAACCPSDGVCP